MKILEVYTQDSNLRCYKKNIFKTTEAFLKRFPEEYSRCYYNNLAGLGLFKVDKMYDESLTGAYYADGNAIFFKNNNALGHEMFHLASNDLVSKVNAFESKLGLEDGLIEGMTEYLTMRAYGLSKPGCYVFEVFCVTMLEEVNNIFRPYFIPNNEDFINLFPSKREIYSLLYSLNLYSEIEMDFFSNEYGGEEYPIDKKAFIESIKDTMTNLMALELSMEQNPVKLKEYADKFMDYLSSDMVRYTLTEFYPKYYDYAEKQINKKIRKRGY